MSEPTTSDSSRPELRAVDGGVVLSVQVQPGARRTEIAGRHGSAVKIRVAARPVDDRANEALVVFVAKEFGLRRTNVTIRSGGSSRHKRLTLGGIDLGTAAQVLDQLLPD